MAAFPEVRPPAAAGQFYEADPERLRAGIESLFSSAPSQKSASKGVRAVILPHAGYMYSALTAAKTLVLAKGGVYKRVLVVAPSHRVAFEGLATAPYKAFSTPLGETPVDSEAMALLGSAHCPYIREIVQAHSKEHALEVELPLLQIAFPSLPIIPLISGKLVVESARILAKALRPFWNEETLWVISSDFTHYGASFGYTPFASRVPENLKELDLGAVEKIVDFDLQGFSSYIDRTGATICGESPIKLLLAEIEEAKGSGEKLSARLADYSNSGEITNDWRHCVGYAGIAVEKA